MLNLDSIEYVTIYNVWFCVRLLIILVPIITGLGMFIIGYPNMVFDKRSIISGLIVSFLVSIFIICYFGRINYAKVEIVDKEKCIEVFGENPQDRFSYIRSEGDKFYYYYVLEQGLGKKVFQNEDELKNSIKEKFSRDSFQANVKNKTTVVKE